jgi:hypothetical protein
VAAAGLRCLDEAGGPCYAGWRIATSAGHRVMAGRNELQRQSGSEGGVGQPEATHPEVLGVAWGSESVSVASGWNRAHAQGIGDFFSGARARPQREVEADRGPQQLARPTRLWRTERERAGGAGS